MNLHFLVIFHHTLEVVCGPTGAWRPQVKAVHLECIISAVGSLILEFHFPNGKVKTVVGKKKCGR